MEPALLPRTPVSIGEGAAAEARTSCRRYLWLFLSGEPSAPRWLRRASLVYQVLVALLIVALFLCDGRHLDPEGVRVIHLIELCAAVFFSAEYVLRIYACVERNECSTEPARAASECSARVRAALSLPMVLDLVSIASLVLDVFVDVRHFLGLLSLRGVRLINILRLERSFKFLRPLVQVVRQKWRELAATVGIAGLVLLGASTIMFYIESGANEQFSSILMSMWWASTALTTVGYGDIYPITPCGRVFGSFIAFVGVGLFALPAGIVTSGFQEIMAQDETCARARPHAELHREACASTSAPCTEGERSDEKLNGLRAEMDVRLDALQAELACLRDRQEQMLTGQSQILAALQALQASLAPTHAVASPAEGRAVVFH